MTKHYYLIGAVVAVAIYLVLCLYYRKSPEIIACIEVMLLGAGVTTGVHLMICAFRPELLMNLVQEDGKRFDFAAQGLTIEISEYHATEILIGGFAGAFVCFVGVCTILKKPAMPSAGHGER